MFYANNLYYYYNGWQLVGMVSFDEWNHYRLVLNLDKIEVWINGALQYSLNGTFEAKSYFAFRDYGLCLDTVTNYINNFSVSPYQDEYEFTGKKTKPETFLLKDVLSIEKI